MTSVGTDRIEYVSLFIVERHGNKKIKPAKIEHYTLLNPIEKERKTKPYFASVQFSPWLLYTKNTAYTYN